MNGCQGLKILFVAQDASLLSGMSQRKAQKMTIFEWIIGIIIIGVTIFGALI